MVSGGLVVQEDLGCRLGNCEDLGPDLAHMLAKAKEGRKGKPNAPQSAASKKPAELTWQV